MHWVFLFSRNYLYVGIPAPLKEGAYVCDSLRAARSPPSHIIHTN